MALGSIAAVNRIDWVDYSKGICIFAVVTMYSTNFVEENMSGRGWMHYFVDFAQPFRMPDFFLIAGLFVSRVINRPLTSFIDSKILYFLYFYMIWVTLKFVNMEWQRFLEPGNLRLLRDYFALYVQPPSGQLWFIYVLPLFFFVTRATRSIPNAVVLTVVILLKLAVVKTGWKMLDNFSEYFVFFFSGYIFSSQIFRLVAWAGANVRLTGLVLVTWFAANLLLVWMGWSFLPGMQLLMGYAGAAAILLLSTLLVGLPWMGWVRYMGENSIVIYLGFVVPLGVLRKIILENRLITDIGTAALFVTLASIGGALALRWAVRNTPLRFLFVRPAWACLWSNRGMVKEII